MTQAVAGTKTESTFETKIERGPDAIKEEFPPPGLPPDWQAAKAAQFKFTRLQRRMQVLVPTMIALAVGIGLGFAALPLMLKAVLAVSAILLSVQSTVAVSVQKHRMDEIYDKVKPDKVKVTDRSK